MGRRTPIELIASRWRLPDIRAKITWLRALERRLDAASGSIRDDDAPAGLQAGYLPAVQRRVPWDEGVWSTEPAAVTTDDGALVVTAANGSDLWRTTAYGFVHDNGHGLLRPFAEGTAVEVSFVLDFQEQFDQAGVLVRADEAHWMKAGVEINEGVAQVGAVTTHEMSDWSLAPVPNWRGTTVTVRASWQGDALVVRARTDASPWQLVRVSPWLPSSPVGAGPYVAAPSRGGLRVRITGWTTGPSDQSLHD